MPTATSNENLSIAALFVALIVVNAVFFGMIATYTDVLGQVF